VLGLEAEAYQQSGFFKALQLALLTNFGKIPIEAAVVNAPSMNISPAGAPHSQSMRRRARNPEYRTELERLAPYKALARIVIRRRSQLKLSQAELAKRMGTSHSAISRIERGQHSTTVQTLRRLAALDTHLVIGFTDEIPSVRSTRINTTAADLVAVG
jgi:ribosome-binding protein aMBF1 (putative translation factor)